MISTLRFKLSKTFAVDSDQIIDLFAGKVEIKAAVIIGNCRKHGIEQNDKGHENNGKDHGDRAVFEPFGGKYRFFARFGFIGLYVFFGFITFLTHGYAHLLFS